MENSNPVVACDTKTEAVDKDLAFMALTLASFAVALISINTALLG